MRAVELPLKHDLGVVDDELLCLWPRRSGECARQGANDRDVEALLHFLRRFSGGLVRNSVELPLLVHSLHRTRYAQAKKQSRKTLGQHETCTIAYARMMITKTHAHTQEVG